jgi:ABC-type polysaccharide/polyol phosphate transport system ATPase subunit
VTTATPTEAPPVADVPESPAIEVTNLSINYRIRVANKSLAADLRDMVRFRTSRDRIVPAVQNVSFEVPRGSVLGVIGRNGAGKSTLLRALSGALAPETGRIIVRGRMSLLAVGLGFNGGLTGRENIRLGGLAAGLSEARLTEITGSITEFAQLDEYLDYPLRTYSTGMRARLGFAVAAHLDPEVLLIDEALSGGDAAFAENVRAKMVQLCGEGRTIVLVTHGLSSVRSMATSALWMHQGQVAAQGDPEDVVAQYLRYCRLEELDLDSDGVG